MAFRVLVKVTPEVIEELDDPKLRNNFLYLDKRQPWYKDQYLQADAPRSTPITQAILDGAVGWAVWADGEGIVRTFDSYAAAARAAASAKTRLSIDYDIEEPVAHADEPGAAVL